MGYTVKFVLNNIRGFILQDNNPNRVKVFKTRDEAQAVADKFYGKAEVLEWK